MKEKVIQNIVNELEKLGYKPEVKDGKIYIGEVVIVVELGEKVK